MTRGQSTVIATSLVAAGTAPNLPDPLVASRGEYVEDCGRTKLSRSTWCSETAVIPSPHPERYVGRHFQPARMPGRS